MPRPVAVITGASRGIGLETARRLIPTHRVACLANDQDGLERAVAELGGETMALGCDITDGGSVASAIDSVVERWGAIDVAVSNAGIGSAGTARHLSPDALARQLDVNLTGNWRFIHACLPQLEASRGYILGVSSAAAILGPPAEGFYAASKAGLEALLDVVRVEVAHLGIDVGVAYMMFIDTALVQEGDREHPDLARMRRMLPGAGKKTFPVSDAADALVEAIKKRKRQVFVPGSLRVQYWARGIMRLVADRQLLRIAPEVDRLTAEKVRAGGAFDSAFSSRDAQLAHDSADRPDVPR
jgi:NAD(P)-dependent dehydrogenase (short-subunit alcohol dehydrogenase family)